MGYKCIGKAFFQFGCAFTICRIIRAAVAAAHFYSFIFLRFLLNFYVIKLVVFSFGIDRESLNGLTSATNKPGRDFGLRLFDCTNSTVRCVCHYLH